MFLHYSRAVEFAFSNCIYHVIFVKGTPFVTRKVRNRPPVNHLTCYLEFLRLKLKMLKNVCTKILTLAVPIIAVKTNKKIIILVLIAKILN